MSDITTKQQAIEIISSNIHTGAETLSTRQQAVKNFIEGKVTSVSAPATTYSYTHSDKDEVLRLSGLTGATAITLAASSELTYGAMLTIEVTQGGTGRNVTVDCGTPTYTLTGVASDIDCLVFKYVGASEWILISNTKTYDAA